MTTNIYGNGTNSTAGENTIVHHYDRAGVKAANRVNLYGQFADKKHQPQKMGKTYKISRFLHIYDRELDVNSAEFKAKGFLTARTLAEMNASLDTAALTEGAGDTNKVSIKKITMSSDFSRYGEMIDYTDEVEIFSEDSIQVRYREELGELANSRHEDLLQRDMLGTPTVVYGGDGSSMVEVDEDAMISYDLIRKGVRTLLRNRAKKNTTIVTGDTKVGTLPIAKAYYAIIGANVKGDLETITRGAGGTEEFAYIPAHKYASAATLADGEVGAMHEVRFIESEAAVYYAGSGASVAAGTDTANDMGLSVTGGNYDVFPILFPTQGSFATIGLKGKDKIKFNAKSPAVVEGVNPYGTKGFFSYNFFYASIILEEEKLLKMLVTASA